MPVVRSGSPVRRSDVAGAEPVDAAPSADFVIHD
jgi:hypothetical protein